MKNMKSILSLVKELKELMKCKTFKNRLFDFTEDEMPSMLKLEMEEHIKECKSCEQAYIEKSEIKKEMKNYFESAETKFSSQSGIIMEELRSDYYKQSVISRIKYNVKNYKFAYSFVAVAIAVVIITLPLLKNINNISSSAAGNKSESASSQVLKDINTDKFQGKLLEIRNSKKIKVGYSLKGNNSDKNISEIVKVNGALAAINAGVFMGAFDGKGGIIIHEGRVVFNDLQEDKIYQNIIGINNKGELINGKFTVNQIKSMPLKEGVSFDYEKNLDFGIPLIISGKEIDLKNSSQVREPRTAIGQKADGTIMLVVIDGRNIKSQGITMGELQKLMLEKGAVCASTLAGGSHSEMFYQDKVVSGQSGERKEMSYLLVMP